MFWLLLLAWLVLIVVTIAVTAFTFDAFSLGGLAALVICLVLGWLLAVQSYNTALDYQTRKCSNWGVSSGLPTKYVNIGYGDWACWAEYDGKWLPIGQIRTVTGGD